MSEIEYSNLAGHITEKLDNTAEYEDWLIIQDYIDELQSNLTKEQLSYINLKKTFDKQYKENQQLKSQLKQKYEVIEKIKKRCIQEISASSYQYKQRYKQQDLVYKVAHERILKMLGDSNE